MPRNFTALLSIATYPWKWMRINWCDQNRNSVSDFIANENINESRKNVEERYKSGYNVGKHLSRAEISLRNLSTITRIFIIMQEKQLACGFFLFGDKPRRSVATRFSFSPQKTFTKENLPQEVDSSCILITFHIHCLIPLLPLKLGGFSSSGPLFAFGFYS